MAKAKKIQAVTVSPVALLVLGMHRSGTSALTRLLHHPELVTAADLSVIAGDVEGASPWQKIKLLVTDWFYGADHDLVVNTGAMSGGLRRTDRAARVPLQHGDVVVWGGVDRLRFHGVAPLRAAEHPLTGALRVNCTLRRAA